MSGAPPTATSGASASSSATNANANTNAKHVLWVRLHDARGRPYYYNTKSAVSVWEPPAEFREPTPRTVKAVQAKGVKLPDGAAPAAAAAAAVAPAPGKAAAASGAANQPLKRAASELGRASPPHVGGGGAALNASAASSKPADDARKVGGSMLRAVQSLAHFGGSKRSSSPPLEEKPKPAGVLGKALNQFGLSGPGGSGKGVGANVADLDRRHWGRPDRLRTMSGEDEELFAAQNRLGTSNSEYRFRTSSSADLIQLLNMTRAQGGGGGHARRPPAGSTSSFSSQQGQGGGQKGLHRVPSFLEVDVKSGRVAKPPRAVSKLATPAANPDAESAKLVSDAERALARRPRRNTTNSLMVDTLMSKPNTKVMIRCVASLLHAHMVRFALARRKTGYRPSPQMLARFEVFNEDFGKPGAKFVEDAPASSSASTSASASSSTSASASAPQPPPQLRRIPSTHTAGSLERQVLTRNQSKLDVIRSESKVDVFGASASADAPPPQVPDKETIANFIHTIFQKAQMEGETIVMILIYVERLLEATKGKLELTMRNWKPILMGCMVLASKVWDDLSMWNADFSLISGGAFDIKRVNEIEVSLLENLQYNVRVPASTYAKYYFQLRTLRATLGEAPLPSERDTFSLERASKMETLSERYQDALGVGWEGPSPRAKEDASAREPGKRPKKLGPGKNPEDRQGIRKRSNTLHEGIGADALERMHKSGPTFAPSTTPPSASLEQVVSLKHHAHPRDLDYW